MYSSALSLYRTGRKEERMSSVPELAIDLKDRAHESLYIEAVKAALPS